MRLQQQFSLTILLLTSVFLTACGGGSGSASITTPAIDALAPSLSLKGANPQYIDLNAIFNNLGASAQDNVDGDISNQVTQTNNVKVNTAGCYKQDYQVIDAAGNKSTATRTVFVGNDAERHSPNSPPLALQDSTSTPYTSKVTINVLDNDTDSDCDPLSIISVSQPSLGVAIVNNDGSISFDPLGNVGSHFFNYTISDAHGGSSINGVTIASHDPDDGNDSWPTIGNDNVSTVENTPIFIKVLANDIDADGDQLILDQVDEPTHGYITKQNGGILYTPDLGYTGNDSFYYGVHDNHGHNGSGLVEITITQ
jgi:hypothetical protein